MPARAGYVVSVSTSPLPARLHRLLGPLVLLMLFSGFLVLLTGFEGALLHVFFLCALLAAGVSVWLLVLLLPGR